MRTAIKAGAALIPGYAKLAAPGARIKGASQATVQALVGKWSGN